MKTYHTGQTVPAGVYVSLKALDVQATGVPPEPLQGLPGVEYTRLHPILALAATPVLAGMFVAAFPITVFAALFASLAHGVLGFRLYRGGSLAPWGIYLAVNRLRLCTVSADSETLPGAPNARYARVPLIVAVICAAGLGAMYVLLFPVFAFGAVLYVLAQVGAKVLSRSTTSLAHPQWEPATSHLTAATTGTTDSDATGASDEDELQDLVSEVQGRLIKETTPGSEGK